MSEEERLGFEVYDVVDQSCTSHHYFVDGGTLVHHPSPGRYVWPSELDLMARLAGLAFCERWGTWTRMPFTAESTDHISVWQKPAARAAT